MYKTKSVKLKKSDLIFDEKNFLKENPHVSKYKTSKSYVPQKILDELEINKAKVIELTEEIQELKREIETLKSLNDC